jgi:hypothetical protein
MIGKAVYQLCVVSGELARRPEPLRCSGGAAFSLARPLLAWLGREVVKNSLGLPCLIGWNTRHAQSQQPMGNSKCLKAAWPQAQGVLVGDSIARR